MGMVSNRDTSGLRMSDDDKQLTVDDDMLMTLLIASSIEFDDTCNGQVDIFDLSLSTFFLFSSRPRLAVASKNLWQKDLASYFFVQISV